MGRKFDLKYGIILYLALLMNLFTLYQAFAYDRKEAVKYADTWALSRNVPAYNDYTYGPGDCTNYVSQRKSHGNRTGV